MRLPEMPGLLAGYLALGLAACSAPDPLEANQKTAFEQAAKRVNGISLMDDCDAVRAKMGDALKQMEEAADAITAQDGRQCVEAHWGKHWPTMYAGQSVRVFHPATVGEQTGFTYHLGAGKDGEQNMTYLGSSTVLKRWGNGPSPLEMCQKDGSSIRLEYSVGGAIQSNCKEEIALSRP